MEALHRHSHPGLDRGGVYLSLPEIPSTSSCFSISASFRSTTPLTAGVLPSPSSCSPVCSAPQGPDCGAGPHRHLPVSDQREPAARCLLAEGGKPGKSEHPSILFFYFFFPALRLQRCSGLSQLSQCEGRAYILERETHKLFFVENTTWI